MSNRELKKISVNLPVDLIDRLDAAGNSIGISRTAAIILSCNYWLEDPVEKESPSGDCTPLG